MACVYGMQRVRDGMCLWHAEGEGWHVFMACRG